MKISEHYPMSQKPAVSIFKAFKKIFFLFFLPEKV